MKMNWRPHRVLFACLALLTTASTAWGAAYRWTDASGNVQYGDQPPAGVQAQRMQAPPPPPLPQSADGATPQPAPQPGEVANEEALKAQQERERIEKENAIIERKNAELKKANCAAARSNLERLKLNRPMRINQGDGTRAKRYTAEERQAATREAQKQVRENCN
jgi:transposase-like protein